MSQAAVATLLRERVMRWPARLPRITREVIDEPPNPWTVVASYALTMLAVVLVVLLLNLVAVGRLQHFTAQHRLYGQLRSSLAEGSVPIGQTDLTGHLVKPGTPLALLSIPAIGVDEVIVEGTTATQTMQGIGHRRDTPLPGQPGVSVLMGRAAAYGGPFAHLDDLQPGEEFTVQTGQGVATYRVIGDRTATTMLPVLGPKDGRLTLITASGAAYLPRGVLRVDAELVSTAFPAPAAVIPPNGILPSENALHGDTSHAFALSWLALLLIIVVVAATWSWRRWHKLATWIVFVPAIGALGLNVANLVSTILPNLT